MLRLGHAASRYIGSPSVRQQHQEVKRMLSVLIPLIIWMLKSITYWIVFRFRKISITALSCFIIGGTSYLVMFVPIPLPSFLSVTVVVGLAVFLTMRYSGVQLIPNGLFIPLGVEILFRIILWIVQSCIL